MNDLVCLTIQLYPDGSEDPLKNFILGRSCKVWLVPISASMSCCMLCLLPYKGQIKSPTLPEHAQMALCIFLHGMPFPTLATCRLYMFMVTSAVKPSHISPEFIFLLISAVKIHVIIAFTCLHVFLLFLSSKGRALKSGWILSHVCIPYSGR